MPNCADAFHVVVFGQLENILWAKYTIARVVVQGIIRDLKVFHFNAHFLQVAHFPAALPVLGKGYRSLGAQRQVFHLRQQVAGIALRRRVGFVAQPPEKRLWHSLYRFVRDGVQRLPAQVGRFGAGAFLILPHCLVRLAAAKACRLQALGARGQARRFAELAVFALQHPQADLVVLQVFGVAGFAVHQNVALAGADGVFQPALLLPSLVQRVVLPVVGHAALVGVGKLPQLFLGVLRRVHAQNDGAGRVATVQMPNAPL